MRYVLISWKFAARGAWDVSAGIYTSTTPKTLSHLSTTCLVRSRPILGHYNMLHIVFVEICNQRCWRRLCMDSHLSYFREHPKLVIISSLSFLSGSNSSALLGSSKTGRENRPDAVEAHIRCPGFWRVLDAPGYALSL